MQQSLEQAIRDHQSGRLREAESAYRQVLAGQPSNADALHMLGLLAHQLGRGDAADWVRQAIAARPGAPNFHTNLGLILAARGDLDGAIKAHRDALSISPNYPEAHHNLGCALHAKAQLDEAIAEFRQALSLRPAYPEAQNNLGNALKDAGRLEDAIAAYRQALSLRAGFPEAQNNLGIALRQAGRLDEAIDAFRAALKLRAQFPESLNNLGRALREAGRLDEAVAALRQAVALRPDYAEAHCHLGQALQEQGQTAQAAAEYRQTLALNPDNAQTWNNLGSALRELRQIDDAIDALKKALMLRPEFAEAYNNLGNAYKGKGELDDAIGAFRRALALRPQFPEALTNLGTALTEAAELEEAITCHRQSLALQPDPPAASNLLYALHFHPDYTPEEIYREHVSWNQTYARPLPAGARLHANDPSPDRRLRIGYVSPDFRHHAVGYNILGLMREHDRGQFEVFCYSNVAVSDDLTEQFRSYANEWRDIRPLSDEQACELIRRDGIDVLVDLALHTAGNRLLIFARKPAPVQVSTAGYPGTTGLETMDYRVTDPYLDTPGAGEEFCSEDVVRLPDSFWCFDPMTHEPPVSPLPACGRAFVTFGCLSKFSKINPTVLTLWARVLNQVPGSRLVMMAAKGAHRQRTIEFLNAMGVEPQRVEFVPYQPRQDYLRVYHGIDIGLDTFPYNGHTTSLDSFWMGVPVITLVGRMPVARAGWCQLCNLELRELAAWDQDQFVALATTLAADLPRLAELRRTLRPRMQSSPLMDARQYTRHVEAEYRSCWRTWCESRVGVSV